MKKNSKFYEYPFQNPALPIKKRVANLVSLLTLDEKIGLLPSDQHGIERLGIGESRFSTEIARGYISRESGEISTVFPQPIGLASTFDPALMYKLGEIAGIETRIYHKKADFAKLMVWGPTVDLCRDPRWGRNEESYGEDPFLAGQMSAAYTKGMSGDDKKYLRVLSGLKHFCCNNHEEDRNRDSANVDSRLLREYYYAAFEPAIREKGAHSVMTAYNELAGVPAMISQDIKKVCKKEWGMLFSVTDGGDFSQNVTAHKYSESHAETIAHAIKAGNNIMTDTGATVIAAAKEAVRQRLISVDELDEAVSEVLIGRFMLGEFDPPELNPYNDVSDEMLNCDEFKATNALAARECITLLKNDGMLPLKSDPDKTIAVVGLLADSSFKDWYTGMSDYNTTILSGLRSALGDEKTVYHDGCDIVAIKSALTGKYLEVKNDDSVVADSDTITRACLFKKVDWDYECVYVSKANGKLLRLSETDTGAVNNSAPVGFVTATGNDTFEWFGRTILRPVQHNEKETLYKSWRRKDLAINEKGRFCEVEGCGVTLAKVFTEEIVVDGAKECAKIAQSAARVIVCCGNDPMVPARECFDRKSLALPKAQERLFNAVYSANANCVLVITSSYPYAISEQHKVCPAIVYTAHGGPEAGNAMADVLLGKYNPAGRTPQTWYKSENDLPDIKDYDIAASGSTYLYFEGEPLYPFGHGLSYSEFEYSDFLVKDAGEDIKVKLRVKNTSGVYGEEVVQIYFTVLNSRVKRPKKQLCDFVRCGIEPGQTVEISMTFEKNRLRFWDVTRQKFVVESGAYKFYAGASSEDVRCALHIQVIGEKIPPRNMFKLTPAIDYDNKRAISLRYCKKKARHYVHAPAWSGALEFFDVSLSDAVGIEVAASTDVNEGKISVYAGEDLAGSIVIPATAHPTEFKRHRCLFETPLNGKEKLTLKMSQFVNLSDLKLLK